MEGATVNGIMCLGNTAGSLTMRYLPKIFKFLPNIPMKSGTAFNEICFGNVYSASSAWTNAGLYVAESVLQKGAITALSGRDIANFDEYKFCFGAGLAAIKFGKFVKTAKTAEKVSDTANAVSNLNKTVGVGTKAYRYAKPILVGVNYDGKTYQMYRELRAMGSGWKFSKLNVSYENTKDVKENM